MTALCQQRIFNKLNAGYWRNYLRLVSGIVIR